MPTETTSFGFPFAIDPAGFVSASGGDEAIRGKIIQVLFTAPGERVHQPEFGCGLFNLVFEPNDSILVGAVEFSIRQALTRWMADDIAVMGVSLSANEGTATAEVVYTKKQELVNQAVRIQFK